MNVPGWIASENVTTTESTAAVLGATRGTGATEAIHGPGAITKVTFWSRPVAALPARSLTPVGLSP